MNNIEIFRTTDSEVEVRVQFQDDTFWLTLNQISDLFERDKSVISRHLKNIYNEGELDARSTVAKNATVQHEGERAVERNIEFYNLDAIISVGYRVNSKRGTQFRQWATQRLKDYLVQGYAINENRLKQKQQEVEYLKTGIRILSRAIEAQQEDANIESLRLFAKGLELLDDYDHEELDKAGKTIKETIFPKVTDYLAIVKEMQSDFQSDVFAKPKDNSFESSVNQIAQCFSDCELYPSLEEKAATLLYLIVKNHSFVDGNKRIAAACFLYFLQSNDALIQENGTPIISNDALATLTLFVASSKTEEMNTVKNLIISVLNRF